MNKRGQALVEFIIILPIVIVLLLSVFDYVNIMQVKISLESAMEDVIINDAYKLDKDIILTKVEKSNSVNYELSKKIEIYSPVVSALIGTPYKIKINRILYE